MSLLVPLECAWILALAAEGGLSESRETSGAEALLLISALSARLKQAAEKLRIRKTMKGHGFHPCRKYFAFDIRCG
jgi:hypothetical protein